MIEHATPAEPRLTTSPLGRRRVLQAAAWSTPVVMLATPTPAFAASPLKATLLFTSSGIDNGTYVGSKPVDVVLRAGVYQKYVAGAPTVTALTFTFRLPTARVNGTATLVTSPNWSVPVISTAGSETLFTINYSGSLPPDSPSVSMRVPLSGGVPGPSGTQMLGSVAASAPNAYLATAALSYTFP